MITREEYNKAFDIVEAYHKQISDIKRGIENEVIKTEWGKWHKLNTFCSTRLRNIILSVPDFYLEDMEYELFKKFKNSGDKTWREFVELRGY